MAYRAARKAHVRTYKANGGAYKANGGAYKANGGAYKANSGAHKAQNGTLGKPTHTARGTRKCGISFFTFRYRISTVFLRRVFCRFSRAKKYVRHISNYVRHILKYKAHIFFEVPCRYNSLKTSFRFSVPYLSVTGSGLRVAARVPPQRIECRKRQGTKNAPTFTGRRTKIFVWKYIRK